MADLTEHPVVGALGVPLGNSVEIRATVVAGRETRMKAYEGRYLLRVTEVDGRALARTAVMEFSVPSFANVKLAADDFGLYALKMGKQADQLDGAQVAELEKGYVGKQVRLAVYETGGYSGIPVLPEGVMPWQDHRFGFSTWLVVLAERP